jgi:hypothetical protein
MAQAMQKSEECKLLNDYLFEIYPLVTKFLNQALLDEFVAKDIIRPIKFNDRKPILEAVKMISGNNTISCFGDIIVGFYFPNNVTNDVITINNGIDHTIVIDDPSRAYLPPGGYFDQVGCSINRPKIDNKTSYYIIWAFLDHPYHDYCFNEHSFKVNDMWENVSSFGGHTRSTSPQYPVMTYAQEVISS